MEQDLAGLVDVVLLVLVFTVASLVSGVLLVAFAAWAERKVGGRK